MENVKKKSSVKKSKSVKKTVVTEKQFALIHINGLGVIGKTHEDLMDFIRYGTGGGSIGFWNEKHGYKNFGVKKTDTAETIVNAIVRQSQCWKLFQVEVIVK